MCHFFSFPLGFILLRYVDYVMHRVRLLRHFAIEPYVVFDGGPLPAKRGTELERKQLREENLSRGKALLAQAKHSQARGVLNWPAPRNVKEVQKFLGLANYYKRFIKNFSRIVAPLHVIIRKEQKWKWEKEQEEAFKELKTAFTTEPVLAIPDIDKEMRVEADASDYATGGVLSTKCEDGKWRPVAFISKSLSTTERNYEIHDKEMLAVIRCLEAWRHYVTEEQ